ncbi:MAG TPA: AAA family ATPase [Thermoplasmata archaeon]|nr:AAA family ATPase [Thermoplasmata archaeon]
MSSRAASRLPLSERLRPTRLDDIVGNARARYELRAWATQWQEGRTPARRAAVLSGPPGVGKTTAAIALAAEFGWTLVEMNASDARNEVAIEQVAGRASVSHTLDAAGPISGARHALILLDEADCLTGRLTETPRARATPPPLGDFLRGRYGSIEALNEAWGLLPKGKPRPFEDWGAVPRTPGNSGWARLPAARRDIDEWKSTGRSADLSDRGGLGAITRLARSTHHPIVLTVNDDRTLTRYSPVFRTGVVRIRFYPLRDSEMTAFVTGVAGSERITLHPGVLESIVKRAHGDVRAALNDLDAVAPLASGPWQLSVVGFRDLTADFVALTEEALSHPRYYRSVEIQDRLDATPDDLLPWIEENLPLFAADPRHRDAAYRVLAVADQFLTRARRARVYGLWSYASELMTGGVSFALYDGPGAPARGGVAFPQFLSDMGRSRALRGTRDSLAKKAGTRFHLSKNKTREIMIPFLEGIFAAGVKRGASIELKRTAARIVRELELTPEEVGFVLTAEPDSRAVTELLAAAGSPTPPEQPESEPLPNSAAAASMAPGQEPTKRVQRHLSDFGA